MDREQKLAELKEKYGQAVETWCRTKAEKEGDVPDEERISRRIAPSELPPPPQ